jgi:predicted transcriptional regulator
LRIGAAESCYRFCYRPPIEGGAALPSDHQLDEELRTVFRVFKEFGPRRGDPVSVQVVSEKLGITLELAQTRLSALQQKNFIEPHRQRYNYCLTEGGADQLDLFA